MFCTKCGYQIKDGYKFCPKCGTPAFVEKEEPKSKVDKEEIDEVTKEEKAEPTDVVVSTAKVKEANDTKAEIKSKKDADSIPHDDFIPNPLIEKELDFLRVRKKAEKGNKIAMLRQAFRYEMGIGIEKDTAKAKELFEKAGGKTVLPLLERSHINYILPDPNYDHALLSTDETNDDKDNVLRVIPFVKDIILDYANKVEQDKSHGKLTEEKSIEYRNEFIQRMKVVRDLHPELLLAYIDEKVTEEDVNRLFDAIKKSSSSRYSLKWIPSLYNFSDSVDGIRIDIPSICEIKSNGLFTINYLNEKDKINLFNQFVYTLLLQIPIKKIRLTFVDLDGRYEYDNLLRQLNPIIYDDKPVTTEGQLDVLLRRLEERQLEVLKKYGNYPEFCEKNKEIPLPYEFVFIFKNTCHERNTDMLNKLYGSSCKMGVYFVLFNESTNLSIKSEDVFNPIKNELYSNTNRSFNSIIKNGISFLSIYANEKCDLILGWILKQLRIWSMKRHQF